MYEQIASNKRRSLLLMATFVALVVAAVWVLQVLLGFSAALLLVALVVAGLGAFAAYWKSDAVALRIARARRADPEQFARLHNVVEGLCIAAGLPKPRVFVIDDPAPNALTTGRSPRHAAIAVTTGMLDKLTRIELEGVVAHELSHVKNYDALVATVAVTLVGLPAVVVPPVFGPVMAVAVNRRRESAADANGASLTRYPPGLISALEKLKADHTVVHSRSRATAHLWIESPLVRESGEGVSRRNRLFDTHPSLDERIRLLKEL
ncbi:MAG: M48 family metalloprotease [Acidimicrobiia bacterium]|nr:M48 family metalloprotease [Acidimicrobiia bacterium]